MKQKSIIIEVTDDNEISIEGHNFKGRDCDTKMRAFEAALGTVSSRQNKPEYAREGNVQNTQTT